MYSQNQHLIIQYNKLKLGISNIIKLYRNYTKDVTQVSAKFSNGRTIDFECGSYAKMADGAVVATCGQTSVLVTAISKARTGAPQSFLPLTVDYRQKYAAAGRIPANYLRREMGLSEQEVLTGRIIDRSVRPMFPASFQDETQLTCNLLAVDGTNTPDVVTINAASAALAVSSVPWDGPVGAVRIGYCDGELLINPTWWELQHSDIDLVIAASSPNKLVMMEGGMNNVPMALVQKAVKTGVREAQVVVRAIVKLAERAGKPKRTFEDHKIPEEIIEAVRIMCTTKITDIFSDHNHDKQSRDDAINVVRADVLRVIAQDLSVKEPVIEAAFSDLSKQIFRKLVLDTGVRCDGRKMATSRDLSCSADVFPALHGSAVFQRGQTQVQCTVAYDSLHLAGSPDSPLLKATGGSKDRNFLLHYTFPSYATNEVGRTGPISRREIGHGALAEKALRPLLPRDLPYTVLLTSTVMGSNGSSSMATICGGSLALFDAGVNLSAPAAGVAMGLITDTDHHGGPITRHVVLTDIMGIEDYMGDMDFKIGGTRNGITALQVDVKLPGLPLGIIMEALSRAESPRCKVLDVMDAVLGAPRSSKDTWPVVVTLDVPPNKRGRLLSAGGINIKKLKAQTGVEIWWEDENKISIFAPNQASYDRARETLDGWLEDKEIQLEFGAIYTATVVEVRDHGLMITLYDDMTPVLLHNSQLDVRKVQHPSALGFEVGQGIKVKYFGRDPNSGQMRLSRRAIQVISAAHKDLHKEDSASPKPPSPSEPSSSLTTASSMMNATTTSTATADANAAANAAATASATAAATAAATPATTQTLDSLNSTNLSLTNEESNVTDSR